MAGRVRGGDRVGGAFGEDVELAEELAIRYMEAHAGPRNQETAGVVKNRCFGALPGEIGKQHGMSAAAVFPYFGQRNLVADFAMYLPFVLLYGFASDRMVRVLRGRYPPEDGRMAAGMLVLRTSVAFGAAGLVLGEGWDGSVRVGGVAVLGSRGGSVCKG